MTSAAVRTHSTDCFPFVIWLSGFPRGMFLIKHSTSIRAASSGRKRQGSAAGNGKMRGNEIVCFICDPFAPRTASGQLFTRNGKLFSPLPGGRTKGNDLNRVRFPIVSIYNISPFEISAREGRQQPLDHSFSKFIGSHCEQNQFDTEHSRDVSSADSFRMHMFSFFPFSLRSLCPRLLFLYLVELFSSPRFTFFVCFAHTAAVLTFAYFTSIADLPQIASVNRDGETTPHLGAGYPICNQVSDPNEAGSCLHLNI